MFRSDELSGYELQCEERRVPGKSPFTVYRLISPAGASQGVSKFESAAYAQALAAFELAVTLHRSRLVRRAR